MEQTWAERQRNTNKLARLVSGYIFKKKNISPKQLYGLAKLSWITSSKFYYNNTSYIKSTKIPALADIFNTDYSSATLKEVALDIKEKTGNRSVENLILGHTGFTNFYKAYRNSVYEWLEQYFTTLLPMFKAAREAKTDKDRLNLIRRITKLPGIPKANHKGNYTQPEYFLTPAFFILDPEIKFPIINGNEDVKSLLSALKVVNSSLENQYKAMSSLYGFGGIRDAADLDQIGSDLPDFIPTNGRNPYKQLLQKKEIKNTTELSLKDEQDIMSLQKAKSVKFKRIHNILTNKLKIALKGFILYEGIHPVK